MSDHLQFSSSLYTVHGRNDFIKGNGFKQHDPNDYQNLQNSKELEMWANAQRDSRPAEHRWRPLFNATKFG